MRDDRISPYFVTTKEAMLITGFSLSHTRILFRKIREKYPNTYKQRGVISRDLFEKYLGIKNTLEIGRTMNKKEN